METNITNKSIFLTGGAGFIGTNLCKLLAQKENEIFIFDNLSRNSLRSTNLTAQKNMHVIKGDVLDIQHLKNSVNSIKPQIVIHMAAIAGVDTVIKSPTSTMIVNIIGTFNILDAIRPIINKVERFVDFSTSEVFGTYAYKVEETHSTNLAPVGEARWTYSVSKIAAEHLAYSYFTELGLPVVTIRPFNVYGPGQVGEGAIHIFISRAINDETLEIHGDGDQIRSWCYIDDMIRGIIPCLESTNAIGEVFNIGNPQGTITINSLAEKIVQLCGSKSKIVHVPKNYADVELRIPSIEKAAKLLNYHPVVNLDEGLTKTIEWYRNHL